MSTHQLDAGWTETAGSVNEYCPGNHAEPAKPNDGFAETRGPGKRWHQGKVEALIQRALQLTALHRHEQAALQKRDLNKCARQRVFTSNLWAKMTKSDVFVP